jgi:glucokinase
MSTEEATRRVIGVDVGGTKTLAVLVELPPSGGSPEVLDRELVASNSDAEHVMEPIRAAVDALTARSDTGPEAIGVGLAGFVDRDGVVHKAPNLPGLVGSDAGAALSKEFDLPVTVDNDANCVAVASHALLPVAADCLVAVTFGTGIGGGIVIDGHLLRGANGFAAEPGHMVIDPGGHPCGCGQRGCWEQYGSGNGLARLARQACSEGRAPAVLAAAGSVDAVRGEHVTDLLDRADAGALEIFAEYAGYVALGFANLRVLLDPDVIVMGGGLSAHGEDLLAMVERATVERFPSAVAGRRSEIVVSPGGPEGGAIGAALLAAGSSGVGY